MIADGRGEFWNSKNMTGAKIVLYLLGKQSDIVRTNNATPQIKNDVLMMRLSYYAPGKTIPASASLTMWSYSATPRKYEANHKLTVTVDDKLIPTK